MRIVLIVSLAFSASVARAQDPACSAIKSEVTLSGLSGRRIDSVSIETARPNLGKAGRVLAKLHVRTRPEVVRRELLFAPGDTVDTLAVAESLRRLRALPFLEYARLDARQCAAASGESLALTVVTRDSWTARPDLKASSSSPRIGLTERDLFGTGQTVSLDVVSRNRSLGAGVTALDNFGFGTGFTMRGQYQRYSDGAIRSLFFSRRQTSLADRWRASFDISDQRHEPRAPLSDNFERASVELLTGVRLTPRRSAHAIYLLGGFESESGSLNAAPNADIVGPTRVDRHFAGPQIGTAIVATRYDTLTWLLAGGPVVDVPRTVEGEILVGVGSGSVTEAELGGPVEIARSNFMTHYDAWLGREWIPIRQSRVVSDLWVGGYSRSGDWRSGRIRAAVSAEHAASNGIWRLTTAAEQLNDPDPDVRALEIYDRALAFVPSRVRLAESAFTMSVERTRHLRPVGGTLELDGSIYGAFSKRWDPASGSSSSEDVSVGVAGVGLSLSPRRSGRSTIRLDYGVPLLRTPGVQRAPRFAITLMPWLESGRHRDNSGSF